MSDDSDNDGKVVDLLDREEAIFHARLTGKSPRRIAHEFRCDIAHVQAVIERLCTPISDQMRVHTLRIELDRLDEIQSAFYHDAVNGNSQAAAICIKIAERRAAVAGCWPRSSRAT